VVYGKFDSYLKADKFMKDTNGSIQAKNFYVLGYRYDLANLHEIETLEEYYKYNENNGSISLTKVLPKENNVVIIEKKVEEKIEPMPKNGFDGLGVSLITLSSSIDGNLKVVSTDTSVKLKDDLGFEESKITYIPEIFYKIGQSSFYINGTSGSYESINTLEKDIILDDFNYSKSSSFETYIDTSIYEVGYKYYFRYLQLGLNYTYFSNELNYKATSKEVMLDASSSNIGILLGNDHYFDNFIINYFINYGMSDELTTIKYKAGIAYAYRRMEIGCGITGYNLNLESEKYELNTQNSGAYIALKYTF
jgi:hypothetical protein